MDNYKIIYEYQIFIGSADELIKNATMLSESICLALEASDANEGEGEGNERLLRHYVSMNVVDKPVREGRAAKYNFRHLLQYLTARRLLKQKFSLAKIAEYTSLVPTQSLIDALLAPPHRSEAELLVAAFKAGDSAPSARSNARNSGATGSYSANSPGAQAGTGPQSAQPPQGAQAPGTTNPSLTGNPIFAMADLLREIEELRRRFGREMGEFERVRNALDNLNIAINTSMRLGFEAQKEFTQKVNDIRNGIARSNDQSRFQIENIETLTHRIETFFKELVHGSEKGRLFMMDTIRELHERINGIERFDESLHHDLHSHFDRVGQRFMQIDRDVNSVEAQLKLITDHLGITPATAEGGTK